MKDVAFYVPDDVTPFGDLYTSEVLSHFGTLLRVHPARRRELTADFQRLISEFHVPHGAQSLARKPGTQEPRTAT